MNATEMNEFVQIWERVKNWPATVQISLARKILDRVDVAEAAPPTPESAGTRGRPVVELIGLGAGNAPPPTDDQVRQWLEEHRTEKYGS